MGPRPDNRSRPTPRRLSGREGLDDKSPSWDYREVGTGDSKDEGTILTGDQRGLGIGRAMTARPASVVNSGGRRPLDTVSRTTATSESSANRGVQPRRPSGQRSGTSRLELALYLAAAIIYIAVGFVRLEVFAWWSYGAGWLVAVIWFGPPVIRRLRRRLRTENHPKRDSA